MDQNLRSSRFDFDPGGPWELQVLPAAGDLWEPRRRAGPKLPDGRKELSDVWGLINHPWVPR